MPIDYTWECQTWTLPFNSRLTRKGRTFYIELLPGYLIELGTPDSMGNLVEALHQASLQEAKAEADLAKFRQECAQEFEEGTPT